MAEDIQDVKYKGIKPKIAAELRKYESEYFMEDKPIPFKGLVIYPVLVRDLENFSRCTSCLTMYKNDTPQGVSMSYLEFLAFKMQDAQEGSIISYKFQRLCEIVFHIKNGIKCTSCGNVLSYDSVEFQELVQKASQLTGNEDPQEILACPTCGKVGYIEMIKFIKDPATNKLKLMINGQEITSKDFDLLRQVILFQNFPDYRDDSWVDPSLRKDYEQRIELQRKSAGGTSATLEDRVVALSINTCYKFHEVWDMPIRKFTVALAMVDDLINYKITKTAIMSGFVELPKGKKGIDHWLYKPQKDMYGDGYKDTSAIGADNL